MDDPWIVAELVEGALTGPCGDVQVVVPQGLSDTSFRRSQQGRVSNDELGGHDGKCQKQ